MVKHTCAKHCKISTDKKYYAQVPQSVPVHTKHMNKCRLLMKY